MNRFLPKAGMAILVSFALAACKEESLSGQVTNETSPDGFAFSHYEIRDDGDTDVSISIAWPTDWSYTEGRNQAVPHIGTELLLVGGSASLKHQEVMEFFDDNNAEGSLYTFPNHVVGELFFTDQNRSEVIALTSELLASPQFPDNWLERIKNAQLDRKVEANAIVGNQMWATARHAILGDTPLRAYLDIGSEEDIQEIDASLLRDWHAATFTRTGVVISVVGAISAKESGEFIDQILAGLPEGSDQVTSQLQPNYSGRTILLHIPNSKKTTLGFVGSLPATTDGQDVLDALSINYLGQTGSGPLFEAVRTELRASYSIGTALTNYDRNNRIFVIGGEVDEESLLEVRDAILETYESFRTTGEFPEFGEKKRELGAYLSGEMEYFDVASFSMLQAELDGQDAGVIPNMEEYVSTFSLEALQQRLINIYPRSDELLIIATSPNASALPGACVITDPFEAIGCE